MECFCDIPQVYISFVGQIVFPPFITFPAPDWRVNFVPSCLVRYSCVSSDLSSFVISSFGEERAGHLANPLAICYRCGCSCRSICFSEHGGVIPAFRELLHHSRFFFFFFFFFFFVVVVLFLCFVVVVFLFVYFFLKKTKTRLCFT